MGFCFLLVYGVFRQQNSGENGGGEDKAAEEQARGGGEADETGHCSATSVWSGRHRSYSGHSLSSLKLTFFWTIYISLSEI